MDTTSASVPTVLKKIDFRPGNASSKNLGSMANVSSQMCNIKVAQTQMEPVVPTLRPDPNDDIRVISWVQAIPGSSDSPATLVK